MDMFCPCSSRIPLHILIALAERDSYGYALMQAIREQSGGEVPVQTASFYRHLALLMDRGARVRISSVRRDGDDPAARRVRPNHGPSSRCSLIKNSD